MRQVATCSSIQDIRQNPFTLDHFDFSTLKKPHILVTNEPNSPLSAKITVQLIEAPSLALLRRFLSPAAKLLNWLASLITAGRLSQAMRQPGAVGLISLGSLSGTFFCFMHSFLRCGRNPVVAYRALLPAKPGYLRSYLIKRILKGADLVAVWSHAQIKSYHETYGFSQSKFIFIPYKANHSRYEFNPESFGDYIFSGGNSERDYKTLFEAVLGLSIPVIVSATNPAVTRGLEIPENVILLNAREPAFRRLMAGSRFVVLCFKKNIIRGTGEATFLNAMWHAKPVIVADNISASDYIEEGKDGFIVPAGDVAALRSRLVELWEKPELIAKMGTMAHEKIQRFYTHNQYKARLQTLALFISENNL